MPNTSLSPVCWLFQKWHGVDKIRGMDIVICTTAQTDEEARELLTLVGAPFER